MFTDDDLKRLKEYCLSTLSPGFFSMNSQNGLALLARLEAAEALSPYTDHEMGCTWTYLEAGEPTPEGGYRMKYAGKWYQSKPINEEPECECGLNKLYELWCKVAGKGE